MAEIVKIDSNTWRFEDVFVRFFLLEGDSKAVMIDSGVNCPNALAMGKELTEKEIILLNTHGDGDHTSGTGAFSKIYMHATDYELCGVNARYPDTQLVAVEDGEVIDLGNRPLKLIHIPGHTKGSIAILDINKRVLYAGDSVQRGYIYMFGNHRDTEQYEASLDKLIAMKEEYDFIYASHDEFLLSDDYAEKVKKAWQHVQNSEVSFEINNLFGNEVKAYATDVCGFYLS